MYQQIFQIINSYKFYHNKMGCSTCKAQNEKEQTLLKRIMDYIERDDASRLEHLIKLYSVEEKCDWETTLNMPLIPLNNYLLSLLGYAVWLGKASVYSYLVNKLHASIQEMDNIFNSLNISTLAIICEKGYVDILKQYLPEYLKYSVEHNTKNDFSSTLSFSQQKPLIDSHYSSFTPVQHACMNGHISIIHFLNDYFSVLYPPFPLDVHSIDEATGENCALISVRSGNFVMMKLLYEGAKADFHLKNFHNEGALQILAASTKNNCALQFLECVMYLVEIIKVDVSYMYEETLLLLENKIIIKYIEEKLKSIGILATKKDLESMFRIRLYKRQEALEERKDKSIVGDTQEISGIVPGSQVSNFASSLKF